MRIPPSKTKLLASPPLPTLRFMTLRTSLTLLALVGMSSTAIHYYMFDKDVAARREGARRQRMEAQGAESKAST
jgi:hypothetical protein